MASSSSGSVKAVPVSSDKTSSVPMTTSSRSRPTSSKIVPYTDKVISMAPTNEYDAYIRGDHQQNQSTLTKNISQRIERQESFQYENNPQRSVNRSQSNSRAPSARFPNGFALLGSNPTGGQDAVKTIVPIDEKLTRLIHHGHKACRTDKAAITPTYPGQWIQGIYYSDEEIVKMKASGHSNRPSTIVKLPSIPHLIPVNKDSSEHEDSTSCRQTTAASSLSRSSSSSVPAVGSSQPSIEEPRLNNTSSPTAMESEVVGVTMGMKGPPNSSSSANPIPSVTTPTILQFKPVINNNVADNTTTSSTILMPTIIADHHGGEIAPPSSDPVVQESLAASSMDIRSTISTKTSSFLPTSNNSSHSPSKKFSSTGQIVYDPTSALPPTSSSSSSSSSGQQQQSTMRKEFLDPSQTSSNTSQARLHSGLFSPPSSESIASTSVSFYHHGSNGDSSSIPHRQSGIGIVGIASMDRGDREMNIPSPYLEEEEGVHVIAVGGDPFTAR
jgi:hypothetical protein